MVIVSGEKWWHEDLGKKKIKKTQEIFLYSIFSYLPI